MVAKNPWHKGITKEDTEMHKEVLREALDLLKRAMIDECAICGDNGVSGE